MEESAPPGEGRRQTQGDLDCQKLTTSSAMSVPINAPKAEISRASSAGRGHVSSSKHNLCIEMAKQHLSDLGPGLFYRTLDLNSQSLEFLGSNLLNFNLICKLDVSCNRLSALGPHVGKLSNLSDLNASNNKLGRTPVCQILGYLKRSLNFRLEIFSLFSKL